MADEKTGNDASNAKPNTDGKTGAPGQLGAPVSIPSPLHPPTSHIMPRPDEVPTEPMVVPLGPPVSNVMPHAPEMKVELTVQPPPSFAPTDSLETPALSSPQAPVESSTPAPQPPVRDEIADSVGLVRPSAKSKPPDRVDQDMKKILEGIKLPEKRSFGTEKKLNSSVSPEDQKLNDVLAANITENSTTGGAPTRIPNINQAVPVQAVFHEEMHVASVHTLKQDLQHVVQEQKMSVVKAVALEQEKRQQHDRMVEQEPPRPPSRAPMILFTVFLFLLLGMGALGAVYYIAVVQSAPGPTDKGTSLVFAEQTVPFRLTQDSPTSLRTQLAQTRTSSGTLGSLLHVVPVVPAVDATGKQSERPATLSEFFASIGVEPPENLMRALGDDFFLGIHTVDKNAPILVIKVVSYDRAFDGMLTWEKTLNGDLSPLFTPVPRLQMGPDGIQIQRPFTDLVMRNYDVRAIKDDEGVIQLYYSFPTRDLLIIAESPYTFTEILSRLQAGRRL